MGRRCCFGQRRCGRSVRTRSPCSRLFPPRCTWPTRCSAPTPRTATSLSACSAPIARAASSSSGDAGRRPHCALGAALMLCPKMHAKSSLKPLSSADDRCRRDRCRALYVASRSSGVQVVWARPTASAAPRRRRSGFAFRRTTVGYRRLVDLSGEALDVPGRALPGDGEGSSGGSLLPGSLPSALPCRLTRFLPAQLQARAPRGRECRAGGRRSDQFSGAGASASASTIALATSGGFCGLTGDGHGSSAVDRGRRRDDAARLRTRTILAIWKTSSLRRRDRPAGWRTSRRPAGTRPSQAGKYRGLFDPRVR